MRLIALAALASMAGISAPSAFATAAGLQCQGNLVALRFNGSIDMDDNPAIFHDLPEAYAASWNSIPFADGNRCKLANGSEVVLRWGEDNAYGWGMGGADPPGFFSLWIDGRKVFSKEQFKSGYASSEGYLNSVFVSPSVKEICRFPDFDDRRADEKKPPVTCASAPLKIDALISDPETPSVADIARIGTITIAATHSEQFCRRFIEKREARYPSLAREGVAIPEDAQQFFQRSEEDIYPPKDPKRRSDYVFGHATFDHFDLWNTGNPNTVVRFYGDWKFFMGDVLFYRDVNAADADIREVMSKVQEPGSGTTYYKDLAKQHHWATITENPDVYEHWTPFRLSGVTYLLQHAAYGSQWTLYRPNREKMLTTVCVFQQVEDHF